MTDIDTSKVTRFEVHDRRSDDPQPLVLYGVEVKAFLQDEGRTLKVFVSEHPFLTAEEVQLDIGASLTADFKALLGGSPEGDGAD